MVRSSVRQCLEQEHNDIDDGIDAFVAGLRAAHPDSTCSRTRSTGFADTSTSRRSCSSHPSPLPGSRLPCRPCCASTQRSGTA